MRSVGRLEDGQFEVEVARRLQGARKWSPGYGINSKQELYLESLCEGFQGAMSPNYIFMNDNALPHRTHIDDEFHEGADIRRMD
ncbi:hypothetical protein TNCV_1957081 [Trichonephila clavipes]|nr:hypothetical protein TNCV_1957081 [Trichonephila clavipes]